MKATPSILGLKRVELLAGLSESRLANLASQMTWRRVPAGGHVVRRAAGDRDVYFVIGGRVRVTAVTASGREVAYHDLGPGSLIGELAAIDGGARSADVVALEDTLLASLAPEQFKELLRQSPSANEWMLRRLCASVREMTERVFELSTLGVQNRVHGELLRLAREAGVEANRATISPAPRHADIAARVSTNREQVAREMSELARRGVVERQGRALVVTDVARLAKEVHDSATVT